VGVATVRLTGVHEEKLSTAAVLTTFVGDMGEDRSQQKRQLEAAEEGRDEGTKLQVVAAEYRPSSKEMNGRHAGGSNCFVATILPLSLTKTGGGRFRRV
jgi:hypothetical protein